MIHISYNTIQLHTREHVIIFLRYFFVMLAIAQCELLRGVLPTACLLLRSVDLLLLLSLCSDWMNGHRELEDVCSDLKIEQKLLQIVFVTTARH